MRPRKAADRRRRMHAEADALRDLDRVRGPLFRELQVLSRSPAYLQGQAAHVCCTKRLNQMRISPLEAQSIATAFRRDPELRRRLPAVLDRLDAVLPDLRDDESRQNFDCPLLEEGRCLVHDLAKPIGCAAWHPPKPGQDFELTPTGWRAFAERDRLNDRHCGPDWKLRVIPLWLRRVFRAEIERRHRRRRPSRPGPIDGPQR